MWKGDFMVNKNKPADIESEVAEQVNKFSKEQMISAKRYSNRKDLLHVVLNDDQLYSFEEVDKLVDDFMKGKVN
jgi:hypothetical protein